MSIQRWDQFPAALSPRNPLSRLLGADDARNLALDQEETPEAYIVRAALPGFRPEDVNVSLTGDTLTKQATVALARTCTTLDPDLKNPRTAHWELAFRLSDLLL